MIKMENGGNFGRHLGFWLKVSWGLLACYFTHIPGHVLKNSACYEIFPTNALGLMALTRCYKTEVFLHL